MKFRDSIHGTDYWGVYFSKICRKVESPKNEVDYIIKKILAEKKNIAVLASGGIDSELLIKLIARYTNITALVFRFVIQNKIINEHDLHYIDLLQKDNNIKIIYQNLNLETFWKSKWFWTYLKNYRCTSPQLPIHAYICELSCKQGYFPILTEMQPELKMFDNGTFHFEEKEKDYSIVKYLRDNNIDCLESPLQSNPEILYSILTSKKMKDYIVNPQGQMDSSFFKRDQYQSWFDIELQERPKFHGFEGSENIDNYYRKLIYDTFKYDDVRLYIPYQVLVSSLESNNRLFLTSDNDVHVLHRKGLNLI